MRFTPRRNRRTSKEVIQEKRKITMQISNIAALAFFEQHIDRYYVQYSDLLSREQYDDSEQVYFAADEAAFSAGQWVSVTVTEDVVVLEVEGDSSALEEAIAYVKTKEQPSFLRLDKQMATSLSERFALCKVDNREWSHEGVFGACKECSVFTQADIIVRRATAEDAAYIQTLPVSEWGNLPVVIRFSRNLDQILLAEKDDEFVGYLVYASSYANYNDIVNVMTHPSKRGLGVGKALVAALNGISIANGKMPYYGEAKTVASAALAASMRFEQLLPPKAVYTFEPR